MVGGAPVTDSFCKRSGQTSIPPTLHQRQKKQQGHVKARNKDVDLLYSLIIRNGFVETDSSDMF